MKIKPVLRYQLHAYFQIFSILYGFIYALLIVTVALRYTQNGNGNASGVEFTTMIGIFLVGLVLFKSAFRFFSSYGVSRRRLFWGLTAALGVTAAATSALDMINAAVFSRFLPYSTFYSGMIQNQQQNGGADLIVRQFALPLLLKNWLWCLLTDFALGVLGFLIAALYYRMGKTLKILVSVGVPVAAFFLIPLLDHNVFGGRIGAALAAGWTRWTLWGLNPGLDLVSRLLLIAALAGCVWLLLRKADVKTA